MKELKPLKKYPDYQVSEDGEIWSFKGKKPKKLQEICHSVDYDVVNLSNESGTMTYLVHQLVMEAWGPARPFPGLDYCINHIDTDKKNNHINNLRWIKREDVRANRSLPIKAVGVDDKDTILFRTTTDASRYFHCGQQRIKEAVTTQVPYRGYEFSYVEKPRLGDN